jgi:hypothetical protein
MDNYQAIVIQLHLTTGHERMFYQENPSLVAKICDDLDGHIFSRASLIIESGDDVTAIPGDAMIGITILTDPLPASFYEKEKMSKTVITQISHETFHLRRLQYMSKVEGQRNPILCELEFVSGGHLFLEFSEVAVSGMGERSALHHLFTRPSLSCRRLEGGFSIWNTAHIVSWSHYPKMEVPANAWQAEPFDDHAPGEAKLAGML